MSNGSGGNVEKGRIEEGFYVNMEQTMRACFGKIPLSGFSLISYAHTRSNGPTSSFHVSTVKWFALDTFSVEN
jgi:hypothetical protein